jgi:hypothetical protein
MNTTTKQVLPRNAAATVYENLNYENAGLCRSLLDAAAESELQARDVIARMRRG